MKKILALILAIMMTLVSVSVAFAADDPAYDASVKVTELSEGDIAYFYKIVEWKENASGTDNDSFKGWKATSDFASKLDIDTLKGILGGDPDANPAIPATVITATLANELATIAVGLNDEKKAGTDTVGADGTAELDVTADGLGAGIYMVLIKPADTDVVYNPVFVSSDFNAGGTNAWAISESSSYASSDAAAKKSKTTLDKTASTDEVSPDDCKWTTTAIGDTVHFTVTTTIPGFGKAFINPFFKVTDKLTDLTLVSKSVKIKSPEAAKTAIEAATGDYGIKEGTDNYSINFPADYLKTVSVPTLVTIEYDAIVNTNAPLNVNTEKNEVWTEFSHDINDETDHSFKKDTTQHYTFTLDAEALADGASSSGKKTSEIVKVGLKADGTPITQETQTSTITSTETWQGPQQYAHFKLYRNEGCTVEYIPKAAGTGEAGTALDIVSGADGRMTIAGLDAGEYWLKEVSCPAGFVMDTHVAHIVIEAKTSEKTVTEYTTDGENWISAEAYEKLSSDEKAAYKSYTYKTETLDSYTVTIDGVKAASYTFLNKGTETEIDWTVEPPEEKPHQFKNKKGTELPSTGGVGTTMLYTFGSIMLLAAAVLLVTKRRVTDR